MPQLTDHLQIERHPFVKPLRLERLAYLLQEIDLRTQIDINLADRLVYPFLRGNKEVGRIDIQFFLLIIFLAGLRIE